MKNVVIYQTAYDIYKLSVPKLKAPEPRGKPQSVPLQSIMPLAHAGIGSSMKRKSLSNGLVLDRAKVRLPMRVLIDIRATVQGSPFRLFLEKAHSLDVLRTKQSAS